MTVSTGGQIGYGVVCEEDASFLGNKNHLTTLTHGGDIFTATSRPLGFMANTLAERGEESVIDEYFDHREAWQKEHPLPVEIQNVCSADCPQYLIAAVGTTINCNRGYPTEISKEALEVSEEAKAALMDFLTWHNIEYGRACLVP
jgi:hypothetical protein